MSGIAGIIDLNAEQPAPAGALRQMAQAIAHRGPDDEGFHEEPGVGLAWRGLRLGTTPKRQPVGNENGTIHLVCQDRLFNARELRGDLEARGHRVQSNSDAEVIAHLWEDRNVGLFEPLRGTFAFALYDRRRRSLLLGRDRMGVAPLFWARRGNWLLFASQIKALLASGLVQPEADLKGIDQAFTFISMPTARTAFLGVQALLPGTFLLVQLGQSQPALHPQRYWDLEFPDRGEEYGGNDVHRLADELQHVLLNSVKRRTSAEGSVASYVSGGIDCSTVAALAAKTRGTPLPTFTIRIESPELDESSRAIRASEASGSTPTVLSCGANEIAGTFPELIQAAESPVLDASCSTLLLLAQRVRSAGHNVVLAGDGSDDLLAGYPWFKANKVMGMLDVIPGVRPSIWLRRAYLKWFVRNTSWYSVRRVHALLGGHHAWNDLYGLVSMRKQEFYSPEMRKSLGTYMGYEEVPLSLPNMKRWHWLNQDLYMGLKLHVPGLLLQGKGDRLAMNASVEPRYPFLDEDVIAFGTKLHPRWKLHGLRDKYLLRHVSARYLPKDIAWRPKSDFIAPFDTLFGPKTSPLIEDLLSESSLRRTGYFDPAAVQKWRQQFPLLGRMREGTKIPVAMSLSGVVATQLWHHLFIDGHRSNTNKADSGVTEIGEPVHA